MLAGLLDKHRREFTGRPRGGPSGCWGSASDPPTRDLDPSELAAWTSVARAILNLHETITRE